MSLRPDEMIALPGAALLPGRRLGQFSWALLDWSQQPYFTLITTFIFAPYFAASFIGDAVRGQELWGYTQASVGFIIALLSPVLGAIADRMGRRKQWIAVFGLPFIIANAALWLAAPGASHMALGIMAALVIAGIAAEFIIVFSNAMLPGLASEGELGRLSGFGWGLGYVGGLLSLVLIIGVPSVQGAAGQWAGPLTALWFLVFSLPLFFFTPDIPRSRLRIGEAVRDGLAQLGETIKHARKHGNSVRFLIAHMIYADGLSAVFAFGGIYAAGLFGWDIQTLGLFGVVLIIFAALGAFAGGWADDKFGSRPIVLASIAGLLLATIGVVSIRPDAILFGIAVPLRSPGAAPLSSIAEQTYLFFGVLIGFFGGPAQAASRTLLARLSPEKMIGEFYGLYAMSGKATSFLAPLLISLFTAAFASQRAGMAVILVFLSVGFLLLLRVREAAAFEGGCGGGQHSTLSN